MRSGIFIEMTSGGKSTIAYVNKFDRKRPQKAAEPINENVRYPEVILIGPEGQNLGKMSSRQANEVAKSYDLDLFCVAPNANPPVCKVLNYSKYRFEQQKAERQQRKNSKANQSQLKEIQLHISIGEHDLNTKAKHAKGFLDDGDRVNVRVVLKGREMAHKDLGEELFKRFISVLSEDGARNITLEKPASWEGKCYSAIVTSKAKKQ